MSERQTPQSHSRVKNITNKNTFPQSEKKDGGKVSTNATANDSQAVVNYNRQQRFHHQNSPSYNPAFAKSDHQYFSQQKAPYKYKNNSNQGQAKSGKYLYPGVSKSHQPPVSATRIFTPSKPSSIQSISPEPVPPPPTNKDSKAPILQGAWANPPKVRSEPSPSASLSPISTDPESLNIEEAQSQKWTEQVEYLESDKHNNNNRVEACSDLVNWELNKRENRNMPAPTTSSLRSGANPGMSGSQGDRMISSQDRNSPSGNNNPSHVTRSGSNSINGPTSGVGSPSGSSVSVNGLERCPIGSMVKCVMLHPSGQTHNGLNGPSGGAAQSQQTNTRLRNVFEGEVLAMDPRTKVLVLSKLKVLIVLSKFSVDFIDLSYSYLYSMLICLNSRMSFK